MTEQHREPTTGRRNVDVTLAGRRAAESHQRGMESTHTMEASPRQQGDPRSMFRDEVSATDRWGDNVEATREYGSAAVDREAERALEREERARRLGVRNRDDLDAGETLAPPVPVKRTTDRWHGSLALFLLRVAVAGFLGLRAWQQINDWRGTSEFFAHSVLPQSDTIAMVAVIGEVGVAVMLLFGFGTRVAGAALAAACGAVIGLFMWGADPLFRAGEWGMRGDWMLLLAVVGLVFLLLGSGGWAFDAAFRQSRDRRKQRKALGDPV